MKVILLQTVKSLGQEGEVVEVSDGHARNFLFPQNLGVPATPEALKKKEEKERVVKKTSERVIAATGKLAQSLEGYELLLQEKVNEDGVLYAAVTKKIIAKALKKAGYAIEESMVDLLSPVKKPGEHAVIIELPHDFEAEIRLVIEGISK